MSEQFDDRSRGNADDPDDIDARFREIIAGWEATTDPAAPTTPRSYEPTEPDDHFEPPAPTLPPAHDATFWLAIVGVVGGPLMILWATLLSGNPDPGWWVVAGIAATVVGFGLIVLRGSTERDPDDDGARV